MSENEFSQSSDDDAPPYPPSSHQPHYTGQKNGAQQQQQYQPMIMSPPEYEIATQHDFSSSQGLLNSEEEKLLLSENPNLKPILPWAKLISKCNNMPNYELMDQKPDEEGRYNLYQLGRSSQCGIKFDTPRISNRHCLIYCKMNKTHTDPNQHYLEAFIEDCSANGTFINKKIKLKKNIPRQLHSGDEISLLNPALLTQPNIGITEEDILKNTYHIMLNLPHQNKATNHLISASKSLKNQMLTKSLEETFGRSNTVIRLLKQQRNIHDFYEFRNLLGTGTSGEVFHGIKKDTGKDWAIKVINLRKIIASSAGNNQLLMNEMIANTAAITKEAEMLRSLRHPNIIHLEDIFSDDENIFLIMELSYGGDLFDRISAKKRYTEEEAKKVMWQLVDAMVYLHNLDIMHRDLKPENILLVDKDDDCSIKISDFGLAKVLEVDNQNGEHVTRHHTKEGKLNGAKTFCGTPQYFAPEVLQRQTTVMGLGSYSVEADMWSVGVIMYVLLAGAFPFSDKAMLQPQLYHKYNIRTGVWTNISDAAKDFLSHLLVVDPKLRLTAKQSLEHPWFDTIRSEKVAFTSSNSGNGVSNEEEGGKLDATMITSTMVESMPPPSVPSRNGEKKDGKFISPAKVGKILMPPPTAVVVPAPAVVADVPMRTRSTRSQKKDSTAMVIDPPVPVAHEPQLPGIAEGENIDEDDGESTSTPKKARGRRKRTIEEVVVPPVRASPRRKGNQNK